MERHHLNVFIVGTLSDDRPKALQRKQTV